MTAFQDAMFFVVWFGLGVALIGVVAILTEGDYRG